MPKLIPIKFKKLIKILKYLGFDIVRVKGSHHIFDHPDGRTTNVLFKHQEISVGLLKKILRDVKLSVKEYADLRKIN